MLLRVTFLLTVSSQLVNTKNLELDVSGQARCQQPPVKGACKEKNARYFFNSTSLQCEEFEYSGCKGNSNNFLTKADCETNCANNTKVEETVVSLEDDRRSESDILFQGTILNLDDEENNTLKLDFEGELPFRDWVSSSVDILEWNTSTSGGGKRKGHVAAPALPNHTGAFWKDNVAIKANNQIEIYFSIFVSGYNNSRPKRENPNFQIILKDEFNGEGVRLLSLAALSSQLAIDNWLNLRFSAPLSKNDISVEILFEMNKGSNNSTILLDNIEIKMIPLMTDNTVTDFVFKQVYPTTSTAETSTTTTTPSSSSTETTASTASSNTTTTTTTSSSNNTTMPTTMTPTNSNDTEVTTGSTTTTASTNVTTTSNNVTTTPSINTTSAVDVNNTTTASVESSTATTNSSNATEATTASSTSGGASTDYLHLTEDNDNGSYGTAVEVVLIVLVIIFGLGFVLMIGKYYHLNRNIGDYRVATRDARQVYDNPAYSSDYGGSQESYRS